MESFHVNRKKGKKQKLESLLNAFPFEETEDSKTEVTPYSALV